MNAESLQAVALAVAAERSVDRVLSRIVEGLVERSSVAFARVWLIGPGDICATCPMRAECPDQTRCLHLSASAGAPLDGRADWSRLTGAFRRFPLNERKIGRIGATGQGIFIPDVAHDQEWIAHPDWVRRENISSFGGQPLVFRDEILGVLAVFNRDPCNRDTFAWLRTFADHAAIAIAHARRWTKSNGCTNSCSSRTRTFARTSGATRRTASSGRALRFRRCSNRSASSHRHRQPFSSKVNREPARNSWRGPSTIAAAAGTAPDQRELRLRPARTVRE